MHLLRLDIYNVRNIRKQVILPAKTFNFIHGKNGSGKSALIEAIFLLGRAKSFRTAFIRHVINFEEPELIISAQIVSENDNPIQLGIRMSKTYVEIHKNQQTNLKRPDLAVTLPIQIIHPKSFELLDAGSQIRREFVDWGVFNHESNFLSVWKNYKKALAQRNALLKLNDTQHINVWDKKLAQLGKQVHQYRQDYIIKFEPIFKETISFFLPIEEVDFHLISGWDEKNSLEQNLQEDFYKDIRDGFTHSGPHRGDFQLVIKSKLVKEVVSRGQLKLLVICLKLAQVKLLYNKNKYLGCILIDDFAAELDSENRRKVLLFLNSINCQIFATATEKNDFGDLSIINDYKMFHVEQGAIEVESVPRETKESHMRKA